MGLLSVKKLSSSLLSDPWVPAFAGMTDFIDCLRHLILSNRLAGLG
ncbi:hypothetical protein BH10PSE7_BH10PSE7_31140 [soil metagenome]